MANPIPRCFIDLDGVLADFVTGCIQYFDSRHPWKATAEWDLHNYFNMGEAEFWGRLGFDFWANLPPTREKNSILATAEVVFGRKNCFIVSSPCHTLGCISGKARWVERWLPAEYSRQCIFTNQKEILAGPNRYLIDDHDPNIEKWEAQGGSGLLVPRPWNKAKCQDLDVSQLVVDAIRFLGVRHGFNNPPAHSAEGVRSTPSLAEPIRG